MSSPDPALEIGHELGSGGSGRVWHARLARAFAGLPAGSEVALKRAHPELARDPLALAAFEREIVLGRGLSHPNLVSVVADGQDESGRWLLMPYVPGRTLREVLRSEPGLAEASARALLMQLASALATLHALGWRHTDLKPENVRWTEDGRAVLMDLGLASEVAGEVDRSRPGSLAYLSPEQARGESGVLASDIFALGVLAYEIATGVHPFGLDADAELLLEAIGEGRLLLPSMHAPGLRPFYDWLCLELCAQDPKERPSAAQVVEILREGEQGDWWRARAGTRPTRAHTAAPALRWPRLPFVGREQELRELESAFPATVRDKGLAIWVSGEPGVGKSFLIHELAQRVRARTEDAVFLVVRFSEWATDGAAAPYLDLLGHWFHLSREQGITPAQAAALRSELSVSEVEALERAFSPHRWDPAPAVLVQSIVACLQRIATERPVLLFLDDVCWASGLSLEVAQRLVERVASQPMLVVLGHRTEAKAREEEAYQRLRRFVPADLALQPLAEAEVLALVEAAFHHSAPRLRLAHQLFERSQGLPALLTEMLSMAYNRGAIGPARADPTALELYSGLESLAWPRSLSQALATNFRSLAATDRAWLQRLAVVGGTFDSQFLARAFRAEETQVRGLLTRLVRAGWLVCEGARWRFARPVQRQAAYGTLSEQRRRKLHSRTARALQSETGRPAQTVSAYRRAFHLHHAQDDAELLLLVPTLVQSSWGKAHPQRVHHLASWGLEAIDRLPPDAERKRLAALLLTRAADAADRLGERARQRAWLDRLADLQVDGEGDPESAGRVYLLHGRFASSTGDYGFARGLLHNAIEYFARARAPILESEATRRLAYVQANVGELDQAKTLAERALQLAASDKQRALSQLALAVVAILSDRFERALEFTAGALSDLRTVARNEAHGILAQAYLVRARTWRLLGRPRRALSAIARALPMARKAGERRLEVEILARSGQLLLEAERVREAEEHLREALLAAIEIQDRRGQALASLFLGILLAENEDPAASELLTQAVAVANETGLARVASLGEALRARVEMVAGRGERAWEHLQRGLDLMERFGAELGDRIVISGTQALLRRQDGQEGPARTIAKDLARAIHRQAARLDSQLAQRRQRVANMRLLRAVLSPEGPIYPRSRLRNLPR